VTGEIPFVTFPALFTGHFYTPAGSHHTQSNGGIFMTAQKKKSERVTKEKILKAIEGGAKSLTAVSKALGFKGSVSGSTAKRIRELVPDIEERMKSAGSKREGKKTRKAQSTIEIPDICPFRSSSSYAVLWTILFNNRKKGITRAKLIERGVKMTGKV
jgi:hypothetical protein